jgi:hypothetical protein
MITEIASSGITIVALKLSQYGYVLETGRLALEGPASDLVASPSIKDICFVGGARGKDVALPYTESERHGIGLQSKR